MNMSMSLMYNEHFGIFHRYLKRKITKELNSTNSHEENQNKKTQAFRKEYNKTGIEWKRN